MKIIWTTQCVLANEITLYQQDWDHVIDGHPELSGKEAVVKLAIERPIYIQEAGNPLTAAYVMEPDTDHPEGVRVIVNFKSEMWTTGNKIGDVATGYPINRRSFPNPDLGKIVWQKLKGGKK